MSGSRSGRPLVTFALLAYNQERYIREAVEGALSQSHEPLEIILSDDCSDDGTYEVIQSLTENYGGPHALTVRRNPRNLGLTQHVNDIFDLARGEIVVLAAGDDISLPQRTEMLVAAFEANPSARLIHSKARKIDRHGQTLGIYVPPLAQDDMSLDRIAVAMSLYIGATGAVRRDLHHAFGPIRHARTYEDLVYGFRAALSGGLDYIDECLVQYRFNEGISRRDRIPPRRLMKTLRRGSIIHELDTFKQRQDDVRASGHDRAADLDATISEARAYTERRLNFYDNPLALASSLFRREGLLAARALARETIWWSLMLPRAILSRLAARLASGKTSPPSKC